MNPTLRERRMQSEWLLLTKLAESNPEIIDSLDRTPDAFRVHLSNTPGWIAVEDRPVLQSEHWIEYLFPRYYPTLPLEAYCRRPAFHPNIHPETGFLCLWEDYLPNRSMLDAVVTTRAVLAHQAMNRSAQHCMQPAAFHCDPLEIPALCVPESCRTMQGTLQGQRRSRLTSIPDESGNLQDSLAISHSQ
ncbi:ubiquitin-conjugating enzyme E2 variant [Silvibacterium acidisoli]|uniref:ubiquitin-conjugating enzyme E2 variant n=1 Tax=Acidobacteriaceae bacterium ZG23-2 TaxID=2883246 RepID=UPI00406C4BD1